VRVVVIGSGLLGVATSWFLNKNGATVTVVDRQDQAAMETSHANAGMLNPSMADPWNAPGIVRKILRNIGHADSAIQLRPAALPSMLGWLLGFFRYAKADLYYRNTLRNVALGKYSLLTWQALCDELAIEHDRKFNGTLKIFRDQQSLEYFTKMAELMAQEGVEFVAMDARQTVALEPSLLAIEGQLTGSLHFPADRSGDARKFCQGLAHHAEHAGVDFQFNTVVKKIEHADHRILSILTSAGQITADAFVVAAGSYSPKLLAPLGIRLPVRPVKGYSITIPTPDWAVPPLRPIIDETHHIAATPYHHRLRVAGTAELAGYDRRVQNDRINGLVRFTHSLFPDLPVDPGVQEIEPWSGLRPVSIDGMGIMGKTPYHNLYLNTGHCHLGWTMSSGAGKLVADLIVGNKPVLNLDDYSLSRFYSHKKSS